MGSGRAMSSLVRVDSQGGTKTITMTSPKTANALSLEMLNILTAEVSSGDKDLRSIVVRGEGKIFSAGHNLKEMTVKEGTDHHRAIFDQCNRLMAAVAEASVPVIAAVDGVAAAAGCQLVAMCDIAVATEKSKECNSRHIFWRGKSCKSRKRVVFHKKAKAVFGLLTCPRSATTTSTGAHMDPA